MTFSVSLPSRGEVMIVLAMRLRRRRGPVAHVKPTGQRISGNGTTDTSDGLISCIASRFGNLFDRDVLTLELSELRFRPCLAHVVFSGMLTLRTIVESRLVNREKENHTRRRTTDDGKHE